MSNNNPATGKVYQRRPHRQGADDADRVADAVSRRLLLDGLLGTAHPPPVAIDSERVVVSALLCSRVPDHVADRIRAADYVVEVHRAAIVAVETLRATQRPHTVANLVMALEAGGAHGRDGLVDAVLTLRDEVPYVLDLLGHVEAVREAAECRQVIKAIQAIDLDVRLRRTTAAQARQRLAAASRNTEDK